MLVVLATCTPPKEAERDTAPAASDTVPAAVPLSVTFEPFKVTFPGPDAFNDKPPAEPNICTPPEARTKNWSLAVEEKSDGVESAQTKERKSTRLNSSHLG